MKNLTRSIIGAKIVKISQVLAFCILQFSTAQFESEFVEVCDFTQKQFFEKPRVLASANVVEIDDSSVPNTYFGNLYVGSDVWRATVCYDTMSDWTVISSDFDVYASQSQQPFYN